jgi:hypothetical protein
VLTVGPAQEADAEPALGLVVTNVIWFGRGCSSIIFLTMLSTCCRRTDPAACWTVYSRSKLGAIGNITTST